ncbi:MULTISPECIES: phage protein NinX family protein [Citrobacter]|nr:MULTISPECIES: phage protein NinX family protein [Citrobacter]ELK6102006.1 DUF2591 family protein [Citrobacter freundii]MDM3077817.1 DUF2591 domain-containing protein [Citrobacter sp. Cf138]NGF65387.1 DUF2591 domain-containing protein [Citrobacter freundii]HBV7992341.1 DUF2591 family protein [Citrobacter freundii]HCB2578102.1 DUF2591 family protein [Citrobacter freundii]
MDYSKLSDFEINCEVSKLTRDNANNPDSGYLVINDYCNNPADAWPIISKNRISIVALEGEWGARAYDCIDRVIDANPLRAAMVVYLLTKESANVQANPARPDIR